MPALMLRNNKTRRQQQERIKKHVENIEHHAFINILTSPELSTIIESSLPEYRQRLYCPTGTLSMFLTQALNEDSSCQKAVNDYAINKVTSESLSIATSTSAYCQARKRLPLPLVINLARETGALIQRQTPNDWHWKNKTVYLLDGTTISMPDTAENQQAYPQPSTQAEGVGFPISRLVCAISLASGAIINASMAAYSGKNTGEQSLLREQLDTFSAGDVVLGDAIYGTYFLLASLINKGVDAVFEQMGGRKTDFRKGTRLGARDHIVELSKPKNKPDWMAQDQYDSTRDTLLIRELRVGGKCLITTFLSPKDVSKKDLKSLYKGRWNVELDLRNIKTTMGMDVLSCKTPEMIEKEIWVYFLAYNLIRLLMAQSALLANIQPREISFKHALQLWLSWCYRGISLNEEAVDLLFTLISQNRVGRRPGRIEPRAVKRRPKPFLRLTSPRNIARVEIKKNGHSKKINSA